jgi:hypothetical protein
VLKQDKDKSLAQEDPEISYHNKKFNHSQGLMEIMIGFLKDKIKILGNNTEITLETKFKEMSMKKFNKLLDKL